MTSDVTIRNRISELTFVNPKDIQDNEGNWRLHPQMQADALYDSIAQVGITDVLKIYHSERYGGLTLIDGHLRKASFPDVQWPALVLDVTDEEADLILASGDAIASLAEASAEKLLELRDRVRPQGRQLSTVLDSLYRKASVALERMEQLRHSHILDNPQSSTAQLLDKVLSEPISVDLSTIIEQKDGLNIWSDVFDDANMSESPEQFPEYDEDIDIEYRCPKCGYEWSGKPT